MKSYCYCGDEKSEFIQLYSSYLKNKCGKDIYRDPDKKYKDNTNNSFYSNLVELLNIQENKFLTKNDEKWQYRLIEGVNAPDKTGFLKPPSIEVLCGNRTVLYLRSDQFGFSAPKGKINFSRNKKKYPYDEYLIKAKADDKYEKVADWIWKTRSIGGSFLWPINPYESKKANERAKVKWQSKYNVKRGVQSYIEDRVDLTLLEVKHYYEHLNKNFGKFCKDEYSYPNDILYTTELTVNESMNIWLGHFHTFENYIDFFILKEFVKEENGKYFLKSIINSDKIIEDNKEQNRKIQELALDDLEKMLNNVSEWIEERSKAIEEEKILISQIVY